MSARAQNFGDAIGVSIVNTTLRYSQQCAIVQVINDTVRSCLCHLACHRVTLQMLTCRLPITAKYANIASGSCCAVRPTLFLDVRRTGWASVQLNHPCGYSPPDTRMSLRYYPCQLCFPCCCNTDSPDRCAAPSITDGTLRLLGGPRERIVYANSSHGGQIVEVSSTACTQSLFSSFSFASSSTARTSAGLAGTPKLESATSVSSSTTTTCVRSFNTPRPTCASSCRRARDRICSSS